MSTIVAPQAPDKRSKGFFNNLGLGFAQSLPQGLQGLMQNYQSGRGDQQENIALKKFTGHDFSGMSPDMKKEIIKRLLTSQQKQQALQQSEMQEKQQLQSATQSIINEMGSMVSRDLPGIGISPLTKIGVSREGTEARSMFNNMRFKIESILLPMVNKGTLAKERFNFIMSQVPEASESQRAIVGKLRGLAKGLSEEGIPIDTSVLDEIPWASEKLKSKKSSKSFEGNRKSLEEIFK